MHDIRPIRADPAAFDRALARRGLPPSAEAIIADDSERRAALTEVQEAQADNPGQWQTWWWVCIAGQALFLPFVFVMTGRWSPRKAREDELAHEEKVQRELAALGR